jgi:predicted HAD superfamily Cof-like phosphohydrolase
MSPTPLEQVAEFHVAFGVPIQPYPAIPSENRTKLRRRLLMEEFKELLDALWEQDLVEIADGLADLVVVAYGTALEYGINLDLVLAEVHASNMSKLGADGQPIHRADGKVLKGPLFFKPRLTELISEATQIGKRSLVGTTKGGTDQREQPTK